MRHEARKILFSAFALSNFMERSTLASREEKKKQKNNKNKKKKTANLTKNKRILSVKFFVF